MSSTASLALPPMCGVTIRLGRERNSRSRGVSSNEIEESRLDDEVAPVDPALSKLGFFLKGGNLEVVELQFPEASSGVNGGDGRQLAVASVKGNQGNQVDVRHSIAVGQQTSFIADEGLHALHTPSGHGVLASIHQRDPPVHFFKLMGCDRACPQIYREIGVERAVMEEVLLDHFSLVAQRDIEILVSEMCVGLHDVPHNRLSTNRNHRLGQHFGVFGKSGAEASCQKDDFHPPDQSY